jgi:hypothetical protein
VTIAFISATAAGGGAVADRAQASAVATPGPDTDQDGLPDDVEARRYHTDPRKRDTDRDGLFDGDEIRRYHTNPRKPDSDNDDLTDGAEVRRYQTDPLKRDTDRDGLFDGDEIRRYHTNPLERDSDSDKYSDRAEVRKATNPRDPRSRPGFPGADTTGVPPGTTLSPYAGPQNISTPNTVIDGKTMGCIRVSAPGVVIRKSKISCDGILAVLSEDGSYTGTPLLIEDSEVDCQNRGGTAISEANVIARRLNIHGCENGFSISQNITVEDSYIHDLFNSAESHTDGIQLSFGRWDGAGFVCCALNVTIRHNTIYAMGSDGSFGTSAIISNGGGDTNILIENNLLAGGNWTLYCEQRATGVNYRVVNNRFSTRFSPRVGTFGPATECADEMQSGNVYHETGRPLNLG